MSSLLPPPLPGAGRGTLSIQEGDKDVHAAGHSGSLGVCQLPGPKGCHRHWNWDHQRGEMPFHPLLCPPCFSFRRKSSALGGHPSSAVAGGSQLCPTALEPLGRTIPPCRTESARVLCVQLTAKAPQCTQPSTQGRITQLKFSIRG